MIADWSVEAGADSPVIEVPWAGWVDLSSGFITGVGELAAFPELATALRVANGAHTLTSKTDAFSLHREDVDPEVCEGLTPADTASGMGSYLDCVLRPRTGFAGDFAFFESVARSAAKQLGCEGRAAVGAEIVVRPAQVFGTETFGWTLYAYAFAGSTAAMRDLWRKALLRVAWVFAMEVAAALQHLESQETRASSSIG